VNRHLEAIGVFDGLEAADREEMVEAIAGQALVESREYSERVTGVIVYKRPQDPIEGSGTTWLPEAFAQHLVEAIQNMPDAELKGLRQHMAAILENGGDTPAKINGESVEVTPARLAAVDGEIERRERMSLPDKPREDSGRTPDADGPIILDTLDNYEELSWEAQSTARTPAIATTLPGAVRTPLHRHQAESFDWALAAWQAGLPGVLNADKQGLGKTLQTIAFLTVTRGLIIADPWIGHILDGRKDWEMRSQATSVRGWFGLIRKGSGTVVGLARLVDCGKALNQAGMIADFEHHRIAVDMIRRGEVARWVVPWKLADVIPLARSVPYQHNAGAVTWVTFSPDVSRKLAPFLARRDRSDATLPPPSRSVDHPKPVSAPLDPTAEPVRRRSCPSSWCNFPDGLRA